MKYLVTRIIKLSKIVEADSKKEAIEYFGDIDANIELVKEVAKRLLGKSINLSTLTSTASILQP